MCRPSIVAMPAHAGVGHDVMSLVAGMRTARALNTTLLLEMHFWDSNEKRNHVEGGTYNAMQKYFPSLRYVKTARHIKTANNMKDLVKLFRKSCDMRVGGNFGKRFCDGHHCSRVPGSYDRVSDMLADSPSMVVADNIEQAAIRDKSKFIDIYWHLRTGDITLAVHPHIMRRLRNTIDSYISKKIPRHIILTQNRSQALSALECLEKNAGPHGVCEGNYTLHGFDVIDKYNMTEVIDLLLGADVVVSMGSSGTYLAPLLRSYKRLVHFYFPPKESYKNNTDLSTEAAISETAAFQCYFIRKGVIPVLADRGEVFIEYKDKMKTMLRCIDQDVDIPYNVSMLHYEKWRPHGFNNETFKMEPASEW